MQYFGSWLCFHLQVCLYLKIGAELASETLRFKVFYKFETMDKVQK